MSGILTSVTMQPCSIEGRADRNSTADSQLRDSRPAASSMKTRESRIASSSSMTWTKGSLAIGDFLLLYRPQGESECRAAVWVRLGLDLAAMRLDDRPRN